MGRISRWQDARTLADLGECTALWLEGRLDSIPARRSFMLEENSLRTLLIRLNRSGRFVIVRAQPGCTDTHGGRRMGGVSPRQRAAIEGFMPASQAGSMSSILPRLSGVTIQLERAGLRTRNASLVVATDSHDHPDGLYGTVLSRHTIARHYKGMDPKLITELQKAMQVTIVDTVWGRNDVIWPRLRRLAEAA